MTAQNAKKVAVTLLLALIIILFSELFINLGYDRMNKDISVQNTRVQYVDKKTGVPQTLRQEVHMA